LNHAIEQHINDAQLQPFTIDEFLGRAVGFFRKWIRQLTDPNALQTNIVIQYFYGLYQSRWMHQSVTRASAAAPLPIIVFVFFRDAIVFVETLKEKVTIVGIDEYGFLRVRKSSNGEIITLQADVHSFDVRNGIIHEKAL
jgi:hypothetical protein